MNHICVLNITYNVLFTHANFLGNKSQQHVGTTCRPMNMHPAICQPTQPPSLSAANLASVDVVLKIANEELVA